MSTSVPFYGQIDPRWKNMRLGSSKPKNGTIGVKGCTLTALTNLYNLLFNTNYTPLQVNDMFIKFGVYTQDKYGYSIINWLNVQRALPKLKFVYRDPTYDNATVKKWIEVDPKVPVIVVVRVSASVPEHFVLFTGNKRMIDSLDGKEKSTSTYSPLLRSVRFTRA